MAKGEALRCGQTMKCFSQKSFRRSWCNLGLRDHRCNTFGNDFEGLNPEMCREHVRTKGNHAPQNDVIL